MERDQFITIALYAEPGVACDSRAAFGYFSEYLNERFGSPALVVIPSATSRPKKLSQVLPPVEDAQYIGVFSVKPGYSQIAFDADGVCELNREVPLTLISIRSDRLSLDDLTVAQIVNRISSWFDFVYGYAYARERRQGPSLYAYGMVAGLGYSGADLREADRIGRWAAELSGPRRYLSGMLRDIYPLNVLSAAHLSRELGGTNLSEWIRNERGRGTLHALDGNRGLWSLANEEIKSCRDTLIGAGLVLP